MTPSELASLKALVAAEEARQTGAGSLTTEQDTDSGLPQAKGDAMARVTVFRDQKKWKVRLTDKETGKTTTTAFATEAEARKAAPRLLREYERPKGCPWPEAIAAYRDHLAAGGVSGARPNRPRTLETTIGRLTAVWGLVPGLTSEMQPARASAAWERFTGAVDTRANTLKQSRTFFRWLVEQGWLDGDPLAGIKVIGARRRGKPKLAGVDEVKKFLDVAMGLASRGDSAALAAATALYLGLRASEVTGRLVRELDANGSVLVVVGAKTDAGNRRLKVPGVLQGLLRGLTVGRSGSELLFGPEANRHWLLRAVLQICALAGVSRVTPHGLRGTHAELAVGLGITGEAIAASLGHESFATTERHYAGSDSVAAARSDKFLDSLN